MKKNKLLILMIVMILVLVNSGVASAAVFRPAPPPTTLNLKVSFSPITIYPPLVIFTATLSRASVDSDILPVVDYFLVTPTLCSLQELSSDNLCDPRMIYLGSAQLNPCGQAVFSRQMEPGAYTAVARIKINGTTVWSNYVSFKVP
jgi:hypothetical protein